MPSSETKTVKCEVADKRGQVLLWQQWEMLQWDWGLQHQHWVGGKLGGKLSETLGGNHKWLKQPYMEKKLGGKQVWLWHYCGKLGGILEWLRQPEWRQGSASVDRLSLRYVIPFIIIFSSNIRNNSDISTWLHFYQFNIRLIPRLHIFCPKTWQAATYL